MSVNVIEGQCREILVENNGEWGYFYLWTALTGKDKNMRAIRLTIDSSFGLYGYYWTNFGERTAANALSGITIDYAMEKMAGDRYKIFDIDKAEGWALAQVDKILEEGAIDYEKSLMLREEIEAIDPTAGEELWCWLIAEILVNYFHDYGMFPGQDDMRIVNPQVQGLWDQLWPHFIEHIE